MNGHGFTSIFAPDLDRYLAFKESIGVHGSARVCYLRSFDRYCSERDLQEFDRCTVEGWVNFKAAVRPQAPRPWMSCIRDFGRWMRFNGNEHAYVLSNQWTTKRIRTQPYLFAHEETSRFFDAAARLKSTSPWKWQGAAFFTLMHSAGLRTCEVRRLEVNDVNLAEGAIDVRWSKGNRSRRLPLTAQVVAVLANCDQALERALGKKRAAFFASSTGNPVTPSTIGVMFNRIWDQAGLPRSLEGKQPRPYDFRHHFAYANIERWMAEGADVNAMLPYLSRYMGHASLQSTFYYIHTSPDFMSGYADIVREGQGILPEVGFE